MYVIVAHIFLLHCIIASAGTALYNAVNAIVIGESGGPASSECRSLTTNLFTSTEEVILEDDEGKAARADFGKNFYEDLLSVFSKATEWVLFPNTITGKYVAKHSEPFHSIVHSTVRIYCDPFTAF